MLTYHEFSPTSLDAKGLGLPDLQDWLVAPVSRTRDSGVLAKSNWDVVLKDLEEHDTGEDLEVHRFGHWGPGWFEIILIRPESKCAQVAEEWEGVLANYPVACDEDFSQKEQEEANLIWRDCYNNQERIKFIRENIDEFTWNSFSEIRQCVRGEAFYGYASILLS
jgi:hypothetical protein